MNSIYYKKTKWPHVTKQRPCPVCGKHDWCTVSPDGEIVFCRRIESDNPKVLRSGGRGWVHKLNEPVDTAHTRAPTHDTTPMEGPNQACERLSSQLRCVVRPGDLRAHAASLGVSVESLKRLHIGSTLKAWSFPMRNARGEIIGIRYRAENGRKWAERGSRQGLFIPDGIPLEGGRLYICEGPTDCAALLDMGCHAIGRASCNHGGPDLMAWARKREVVVVADRDEDKTRPDGTTWNPGMDGAKRLAFDLRNEANVVYMIQPPRHKDARAWHIAEPAVSEPDLWLIAQTRGVFRG